MDWGLLILPVVGEVAAVGPLRECPGPLQPEAGMHLGRAHHRLKAVMKNLWGVAYG
jgi:hypothetical protein